MMDPTTLRVFLAVARRLNFTRAAQDVHLSQPAVSRRIQQLEIELGVKLFEQVGKTVSLTDAGHVLAREGARLVGDLERVRELVRSYDSPDLGTLRIGASATPGFYLLPQVLGAFHRSHPAVELVYRVENTDRIVQKLIRNEIDLGFVGAHAKGAELREELQYDDEIVCFAAPCHPFASRRSLQPSMLRDQTVVLRESGSATRALIERWLGRHKVRITRTIELGCPEAIKAVVAAGLGVSFMSRVGVAAELSERTLQELSLPGLPLRRQLAVVRHVDKPDSPVLTAFVKRLPEELQQQSRPR